jgi:CDP-diacylglycerol--serine O-phosphatidyltransferase
MVKRIDLQKSKQSLIAIPFFFTFANAALGLLSILQALDAEYVTAAYCILLAAFMDSFDGRVARALGLTSSLGMELDSLCDAISFCLAPAVLLYSFSLHEFGILGTCAVILYLCAGLFRLARFNVTSSNTPGYFLGLPTPMAAFVLICLVIYNDWISNSTIHFILNKYWLVSIIIACAILMVSSILFPSFKQAPRQKKKLFIKSIPLAMITCLAVFKGYPLVATMLLVYLISSIGGAFKRAYQRYQIRHNNQPKVK